MLDKDINNFETDDQLRDQGWQQMKDLLDKEMPVAAAVPQKSRGRSYLGLLLLLLVGFGAGVGSVLLWQQTSTQPETVEKPNLPVAALEAKPDKETTPIVSQTLTPDLKQQATKNQKIPEANNVRQNLKQIQKPNNNSFSNAQPPILITKNNSSDNNLTSPTPLDNAIYNQPAAAQQTLLLKSKPALIYQTTNLLPIHLENKTIALVEQDENKYAITKLIVPTIKNVKVNWSLLAGLHSEPGKGYGGYTTGVAVDVEVDSRFGLQTGLMFSRYQFNDITLNDGPGNFDLNHSNDSAPGISNEVLEVPFIVRSSGNGSVELPLGSATYFSVPVMLTYKPVKKLRVNMGVEYARMVAANAIKLNSTNSNFDYNTSYNILDGSSNYGDLLNKVNFSATFGLSYLPSGPFGLDIRYNHGFSDLSNNGSSLNQQNDTRESIQFSLNYYFGKGTAK